MEKEQIRTLEEREVTEKILGGKRKTVMIAYQKVFNMTLLYLMIPFSIFILTWVKTEIAVPCLLLLGTGILPCFRGKSDSQSKVELQKVGMVYLVLVAVFWCWSAGIGGFFYQSPDHHFRNAVFRDLIYEKWPVIYEEYGTGMVYYLGIWIAPAFLGKMLLWMGLAEESVWTVSNAFLLLWCSLGVVLLILLLCLYFQAGRASDIAVLVMILIGFSGLDIVGEIWNNGWNVHNHIEWWSEYFQFRSNTTSIFWAYNQAIPGWLMTILLLSERDMRNYGLILGSALFYAPFAVVGISLCITVMIFGAFREKYREGKIREALRNFCSYRNVTAVFVMLPVMLAYYACNAGCDFRVRPVWEDYGGFGVKILTTWICFFLLEAGIYICLVAKNEYRKPLYYATAVSLMAGSILAVGETGEVVFRISATMPALFVLMCFVMEIVFDRKKKQGVKNRVCAAMIFVTMALGAVTPVIEYIRAIEAIQERGTVCAVADDLKTLNSEDAPDNFIGKNIQESFFYRYMMPPIR